MSVDPGQRGDRLDKALNEATEVWVNGIGEWFDLKQLSPPEPKRK